MSFSEVVDRFEWIVWDFRGNNTLLELEYIVQHIIDIITYHKPFSEEPFAVLLLSLQGLNSRTLLEQA